MTGPGWLPRRDDMKVLKLQSTEYSAQSAEKDIERESEKERYVGGKSYQQVLVYVLRHT